MDFDDLRQQRSPEQRRHEIAKLLAVGVLRLARQRRQFPGNSAETCLELSRALSLNGPRGERDPRAANAAARPQKSEPTKCANTSPALTTTTL
jgi:hypothetical protein